MSRSSSRRHAALSGLALSLVPLAVPALSLVPFALLAAGGMLHTTPAFAQALQANTNYNNRNLTNYNNTPNLYGATNVSNSTFINANLTNARLEAHNFFNATFTGANLTNAMMFNADLRNTDRSKAISSAQIRSLNKDFAGNKNIDLRLTNFSGNDLSDFDLSPTSDAAGPQSISLDEALFTDTNLSRANLTSANLSNAKLNGATLTTANFTGANLSGADLRKTGAGAITSDQLRAAGKINGVNLSGNNLTGFQLNGVDLSGANLSGSLTLLTSANLDNANLTGANLSTADLSGASLSGATLTNANLNNADLRNTRAGAIIATQLVATSNIQGVNMAGNNLIGFNLSSENLTGANLTSASLTNADLTNANLTGVNLTGATLFRADLRNTGVGAITNAQLVAAFGIGAVNLSGNNLSGFNLQSENLSNANFSSANLASANLSSATLTGANLTSANLTSANFSSANLTGVNLTGATLTGVTFTGATLTDVNLANVNLSGVSLVNVNLTNVNLGGSNLSTANLSGANLSDANLNGATLTGTNLSGVNLRNADVSEAITDAQLLTAANIQGVNLSGNSDYQGAITGTGALTKSGVGELALFATNTYSGGTTLNAGRLHIVNNAALGTGTITINGGHIRAAAAERTLANPLALNGSFELGQLTNFTGNATLGNNVTVTATDNTSNSSVFSGVISGNFGLTKAGAGVLTLSGNNTFTGATTVNAGVLQVNGSSQTSGYVLGGGTLDFANNAALSVTVGSLAGTSGTVALGAKSLRVNQSANTEYRGTITGTGALRKDGAGDLELFSANTYSGGTALNAGRLLLASEGALGTGTLTINGGHIRAAGSPRTLTNPLVLNGNFEVGQLTNFAGSATLGANVVITAFDPTINPATFSGSIGGGNRFGITKAGPGIVTLSGANTYRGTTFVDAGTLRISGTSQTAGYVVANGATLDTGAGGGMALRAGQFVGGTGTLTGNLVNTAGIVSPSNLPGTLTVNGDYAQSDTGVLNIEIASQSSFDRLLITGAASLGGVLNIAFINGYEPQVLNAPLEFGFFTTGGNLSGMFSSVNITGGNIEARGYRASVVQSPNGGGGSRLSVVVIPEANAGLLALLAAPLLVGVLRRKRK